MGTSGCMPTMVRHELSFVTIDSSLGATGGSAMVESEPGSRPERMHDTGS